MRWKGGWDGVECKCGCGCGCVMGNPVCSGRFRRVGYSRWIYFLRKALVEGEFSFFKEGCL